MRNRELPRVAPPGMQFLTTQVGGRHANHQDLGATGQQSGTRSRRVQHAHRVGVPAKAHHQSPPVWDPRAGTRGTAGHLGAFPGRAGAREKRRYLGRDRALQEV